MTFRLFLLNSKARGKKACISFFLYKLKFSETNQVLFEMDKIVNGSSGEINSVYTSHSL